MEYNGWIVRMQECMNVCAQEDCGINAYIEKHKGERKYKNFTAYGEFDRLQFIPVQHWNEYHENFLFSHWIGQQQTVMLFNIGEDVPEKNIESYILEGRKDADKGRFNILTMLHLSNEVKETQSGFEDMLVKIRNAIFAFVDLYDVENTNDILRCDIYGTFSSSEVAIIWSATQYVDVINILDYLRYLYYKDGEETKKVFIASYTIVALNPYYKGDYSDVRGDALVQVEVPPTSGIPFEMEEVGDNIFAGCYDVREALKQINPNAQVMSSVGKYDFIVNVPAAQYLKQQNTAGTTTQPQILYGAKTVVLVCSEQNEMWKGKIRENSGCLEVNIDGAVGTLKHRDSKLQEYWNTYGEICARIKPYDICFEFRELLSLMFSDYKKIIASSVDQKWLEDYEAQFDAIIHIIDVDVKTVVEAKRNMPGASCMNKLLKRCAQMGGVMRQQVDHILESSKLFFASPNSNMGYTAQFDLMMHMYYGIIKSLIANAYKFQDNSWQYPLVPIVTFTNVPEIESFMYHTADESLETGRLIQFCFPCDAWERPMFYLPYLIHEVYHYITPYDRGHRNLSFLVIALTEICAQYFEKSVRLIEREEPEGNIKRYYYRLKTLMKDRLYRLIVSMGEELLIDVERNAPYREKTFGFQEEKVSDIPIYQMQNAFLLWWHNEKGCRHTMICEWIQKIISEVITQGAKIGVSAEERDFLNKIGDKIGKAKYDMSILSMGKEFDKRVDILFHYLREIYPDYAMIEHLELDVSEYLLQIAADQSNKLITPQSVSTDFIQMCAFRIVPIIEYMMNGKKMEEYKEKFCTLYVNIIHTIHMTTEETEAVSEEKEGVDTRKLAESWFEVFQRCYDEYKEEYTVYGLELKNQIENYKYKMEPVQEICDIYGEYLKMMCGDEWKSSESQKTMFDLYLRLVLKMQNQVSISDMNQNIKVAGHEQRHTFNAVKIDQADVILEHPELTTYVLHGGYGQVVSLLSNMVKVLDGYHNEIFGCHLGHEDLWYRGINNEKYSVLPSIYRHYKNEEYHVKYDDAQKQTNISLQQLQHHLLQRFRYQADGAPEILNQAVYQENDYLALMQHYQLPSNLLDWSEDVFAALYFALEDYIKEDKEERSKSGDPAPDPAVYIFDPAAYNKAREEMIVVAHKECEQEQCEVYGNQELLWKKGREVVPNVSVEANRDIMSDFFCKNYFDDSCDVHAGDDGKNLLSKYRDKGCERCKLPVAYYCSRLSPRIRAQSGQFLAFNLGVHPRLSDENKDVDGNPVPYEKRLSFDYMSLDEIQRYYLESKSASVRYPFLLKMVIPAKECENFARLLRKFGVKTIKYYPELTHLKE